MTTAPAHLSVRRPTERLFCEPQNFVDMDAWHRAAAELRRAGPVHHFDDPVYGEFWAVTHFEPLLEVSRNPDVFPNTEQAAFVASYRKMVEELPVGVKTLLSMDGGEHAKYRKVVADWFKPSTLRRLQEAVDGLVEEAVAHLHELGGECDFATEIALRLPLRVIMSMLGVPPEDEPLMLKLTQEMFSSADGELGKGNPLEAMAELATYFMGLTADRQANPTADLTSAIANAEVDGAPLDLLVAMGLYAVIATAGHDTTSFAMSGGIEALTRFPDEFERLRQHPDLIGNAAHEFVRYTSPVRHFTRQAQADVEVAGQAMRAGDRVLLSYPSANRDESMFPDPDRLDAGRPNASRHVGWGHGPHYCLGARLAQMEIESLLRGLTREVTTIEAAGAPAWTAGHFVSGMKHLPIRCRF